MKAVLVVYNYDGVLGYCTERCYGARPGPCHKGDCRCVCRGRNHGVGFTGAMHNRDEVAGLYSRASVRVRANPAERQQLLGGPAWVDGSR